MRVWQSGKRRTRHHPTISAFDHALLDWKTAEQRPSFEDRWRLHGGWTGATFIQAQETPALDSQSNTSKIVMRRQRMRGAEPPDHPSATGCWIITNAAGKTTIEACVDSPAVGNL
jgi:hypothetical protein